MWGLGGPGRDALIPFGLQSQNATDREPYKQQTFISHSCGGWKSKIKVPAGLVSPEASLCGLHMDVLLLSLPMVNFLCSFTRGYLLCVLISSYEDKSQIEVGPTLKPHFNLIASLKAKSQIQSYSEVLGGQHANFEGTQFSP